MTAAADSVELVTRAWTPRGPATPETPHVVLVHGVTGWHRTWWRVGPALAAAGCLRERGRDVELLFRKFASDFADKYKVKPITLTDDAKEVLIRYRFPGNIRQLKNLVEQISVLSTEEKEISAEQLQRYLPKENN